MYPIVTPLPTDPEGAGKMQLTQLTIPTRSRFLPYLSLLYLWFFLFFGEAHLVYSDPTRRRCLPWYGLCNGSSAVEVVSLHDLPAHTDPSHVQPIDRSFVPGPSDGLPQKHSLITCVSTTTCMYQ